MLSHTERQILDEMDEKPQNSLFKSNIVEESKIQEENKLDKERNKEQEKIVNDVIESIFDTYDDDNSGELSKDEIKQFVLKTLGKLGSGIKFSDKAFDQIFNNFDTDQSGTVDREEMVDFIKSLYGYN